MLFSKKSNCVEDKCRKKVFCFFCFFCFVFCLIKICVLTDIKQKKKKKKKDIITRMYYKVDKNKSSIFFQAVFDNAILHVAFLYSWLPHFLAVKMERIRCEKSNQ